MDLWKKKVVPKIHKLLGKDGTKKAAAAAEACKSFDEFKEEISKEFEGKKEELKPKVIEIYEASSTEIKTLIKEPDVPRLKKHSSKVQKFLDELVKIEFPGSKTVGEATSKYGAASIPGPVIFVFEKVSTLIVTEEKTAEITAREVEVPPLAETTTKEPPAPAAAAAAPAPTTKEPPAPAAAAAAPAPTTKEPPAPTTTTTTKAVAKEVVTQEAAVVVTEKVETPAKDTKEPAAKVEAEKTEAPKA